MKSHIYILLELVLTTFALLNNSSNVNKIVSFYIYIEKLACNCGDILRANNNIMKISNICSNGWKDKNDVICEYALSSIVPLLCSLNEENELLYFGNIIPLLFENINNKKDIIVCKICEKLQILAENQPNLFRSSINPIIECLVSVTKLSNLEWDTHRLSMNLLITLLRRCAMKTFESLPNCLKLGLE